MSDTSKQIRFRLEMDLQMQRRCEELIRLQTLHELRKAVSGVVQASLEACERQSPGRQEFRTEALQILDACRYALLSVRDNETLRPHDATHVSPSSCAE